MNYTVDANRGDTFVYKTGSLLLFPPSAFVDASGQPVSGKVQIQYREFRNPLEFALSGIPMNYDSAGRTYQFISAGMFEILAFKDNKPVFVNPAANPEIMLSGQKDTVNYNAYYLDTVKRTWIYQHTTPLTIVNEVPATTTKLPDTATATLSAARLIQPEKASNNSPIIAIKIDPSSFKELQIYNNLKFQLDSKQPFDPQDAKEEWTHVQLKEKGKNGAYIIQFTNARKTVTYQAKPVFEGADYDAAMALFKQKQIIYEQQKQQRVQQVAKQRAQLIQDSITETRLTAAENIRIEKLNRFIDAKNKELEKQAWEAAQKAKLTVQEERKKARAAIIANIPPLNIPQVGRMYRSMPVNLLGRWNCDGYYYPNKIELVASFVDTDGQPLNLSYISVVNRRSTYQIASKFVMDLGFENAIVGSYNGHLFYMNANDVKKLNITRDTRKVTFTMTRYKAEELSYDDIQRSLAESMAF